MTYWERDLPDSPASLHERIVGPDTSGITVRTPRAETLAPYRADPAYTDPTESSGLGWWDRIRRWLLEHGEPVSSMPWMDEILYGLTALIVTAILVAAVRWLLRMRVTPPVEAQSAVANAPAVTREDMETVDFTARAEDAAAAGNYRKAVRHHYLAVLQHLMEADLIHWTPTTANRALVRETHDHPVHASFARATDVFENVRYGGMSVDAETYDDIRGLMCRVRDSMQASAPSR